MSFLEDRLGGGEQRPSGWETSLLAVGASYAARHRDLPAGEHATIHCRSAITGLHAANLVSDISDAADRSGLVVVDLTFTTRIDAAGLGALVSGARACRDAGSELCIVGAAGMVARALAFTGLARVLSPYAPDEAPDESVAGGPLHRGVDEPWISRRPPE